MSASSDTMAPERQPQDEQELAKRIAERLAVQRRYLAGALVAAALDAVPVADRRPGPGPQRLDG